MNKTYRYLTISVWVVLIRAWFPTVDTITTQPIYTAEASVQAACMDTLIVTVGDQCQFLLTYDQLLTGAESCAASDFNIYVEDEDPTNGPIVDGCGVFRYVVEASEASSCSDFSLCWGYVRAEDKTAPAITLPADTTLTLSCAQLDEFRNQASTLDITGRAVAYDNCAFAQDTNLVFTDQVSYNNDCDTILLSRAFEAEDDKGNRSVARQTITLAGPALTDLMIVDTMLIDAGCDFQSTVERDAQGSIHPSVTGYPFYVNGLGDTIQLKGAHCNLSATYSDETFSLCTNLEKVVRTWTISDWCSGDQRILTQLIKFGDINPPLVACRQDTLQVSTDPFACTASFMLPFPKVTELCGDYEVAVEWYINTTEGPYGFAVPADTQLQATFPFSAADQVLISDAPIGTHFARFIVRDACKNITTIDCPVVVRDEISPIVRCDDQINLSLNDSGYGQLLTSEIDEGTQDNCGLALLEVRRRIEQLPGECAIAPDSTYSEWGPMVTFNCCDAGSLVKVELRAFDHYGNVSTCWGTVLVEDKVRPRCVPPTDRNIVCDSLPVQQELMSGMDLNNLFGSPVASESCAAEIREMDPVINLDECRTGTIVRRFQALDAQGQVRDECEQMIEVIAKHDYSITFPKDYEEFCAEPTPDSVIIVENACDLTAVSIQDEILETRAEECYKIFRTWRVINWCEYDGEAQPTIVSRDWDAFNGTNPMRPDGDDRPGDEDIVVHVKRNFADDAPDTVYFDNNNNPYDNSVVGPGDTTYGYWWRVISGSPDPEEESYYEGNGSVWANDGDQFDSDISGNAQGDDNDFRYGSFGFWQYTQHIKVTDTIPPEIFLDGELIYCITADDCSADVSVSVGVTDNCVFGEVDIDIEIVDGPDEFFEFAENPFRVIGRYPKYILDGRLPEGEYRIEMEAKDLCGNIARIVFDLRVVDCKAPSPICINGLAAELMPVEPGTDADGDGDEDFAAMAIWASDFVASDVSDCTGPVTYSINRKGETPNPNQDAIILTCDDFGYLEIEIHAWDNADNPFNIDDEGNQGGPNHDFCNTYVLVQDNLLGLCDNPSGEPEAIASGSIHTPTGEPVSEVTMQTNVGTQQGPTGVTDAQGAFHIDLPALGHDYTFTPRKIDQPLAGVSTFDIVQIARHILNMAPLQTPYQRIAADVNQSGTITTLDMIQLRKLILRIDTQFPGGTGWRFVRSNYSFADPVRAEAEDFAESISINNLIGHYADLDFTAIKLGDVNESAQLRSTVALRIPQVDLTNNQPVSLPVFLPDHLPPLEGVQLSLQADPEHLELIAADWVQFPEGYAHLDVPAGRLSISWDAISSGQPLRQDRPLCILRVKARGQIADLSEVLYLDQRWLPAEAYSGSARLPLQLTFGSKPDPIDRLGAPNPNPFISEVVAPFFLAKAQTVSWCLMDQQGRLLRSWQETRPSGLQELQMDARDFPGSGLYYLQLRTQSGLFTQRLLQLE